MLQDEVYLGSNISTVLKTDECEILELKSDNGEGKMTCYEVFSGITLIYNDFHMESCYSEVEAQKDIFTFSFVIFAHVESIKDATHVLKIIDNTMDKLESIEKAKFIDEEGEDIKLKLQELYLKMRL